MTQQSASTFLNNRPCLLPNAQYGPAAAMANSYTCPVGREPGRACVLLLRAQVIAMRDAGEFDLPMTLRMTAGGTVTFPGLYFLKATNVSPGAYRDPQAAYLVELVDVRWLLAKVSAANRKYNVRMPAPLYDAPSSLTTEFYRNSLKSDGTVPIYGLREWTWDEVCENLWAFAPLLGLAGEWPGLPYEPDGAPEDWRFEAAHLWCALNDVLHKLHCAMAYDPIANTFSVVEIGTTQANLAVANTAYGLDMGNDDIIEGTITQNPKQIAVTFRQFPTQSKVEHIYRYESINTDLPGAATGLFEYLHDDLTVQYSDLTNDTPITSNGLISNQTDLDNRAAERVAKWLQDHSTPRGRRIVQGIAPEFLPGSEAKVVSWRCRAGEGYVTEILTYPGWPMAQRCECTAKCREPFVSEIYRPALFTSALTLSGSNAYPSLSGNAVRTGNCQVRQDDFAGNTAFYVARPGWYWIDAKIDMQLQNGAAEMTLLISGAAESPTLQATVSSEDADHAIVMPLRISGLIHLPTADTPIQLHVVRTGTTAAVGADNSTLTLQAVGHLYRSAAGVWIGDQDLDD